MKTLTILWRRLVKDGETCERCSGTQTELRRAMKLLRTELRPLGVEPRLRTEAIDETSFKAESLRSNQIRIAVRALEDWLDARAGSSRCCAVCGDAECRTVEWGGERFETIPADLIVKAALRAARQLPAVADAAPAYCPQAPAQR